MVADTSSATPKFPRHSAFHRTLKKRVDAWFEETGRSRDGGARLIVKAVVILAWLATSYVLLVGFAATWWQALLAVTSLGLAASAVGFNIMHDGGHQSFSRHRWLNRLTASALDMIGGSSFIWNQQHNKIHHHYTNIDGTDDDIVLDPWVRLAPSQPMRPWQRWQWLYAWPLYSWLPPKWLFWDDYMSLLRGKLGDKPIPRPKGRELALLIGGKLWLYGLLFAIPLLLGHSFAAIAGLFVVYSIVHGVTLSVVFQLAHCVEEARIVEKAEAGERMPLGWTEHQLATTVDFCPKNRLINWYVGGLNFQIEHHLFPRISHVHYPALAPLVQATCEEHGIAYNVNPTLFAALRSHARFLYRMGRETAYRPLPQPELELSMAG